LPARPLSRSPVVVARWLVALAVAAAGLLPAGGARADDAADAKAHYQKATAHFAVGEYREAASEYEEAFKLKQDPAILFNAAQAHRLAGDSQKALLLYNNVIKLYPTSPYAADSQERISKLSQAGAGPTAPPPTEGPPGARASAPSAGETPAPAVAPAPLVPPPAPTAPAPAAALSASALAAPPPPPEAADRPIYKRWWFWTAAGGLVALSVVAVVVLASGSGGSWNNVPDVRASLVHW
jgi:tetratricopeptide (TPR) repeat protein